MMMGRWWRAWLATLAVFLLAACDMGPSNPLIGTWRMAPEKGNPLAEGLGFLMQGQTVVFTQDTMISGGEAVAVEYEVTGDRVIVYTGGNRERGTVYLILAEDRMANELPLGQRIPFERVAE
ncbi:MAG: hypothetical protein RLY86_812 [Pseudomonadota bacterium]|jgi:hypothetical protein